MLIDELNLYKSTIKFMNNEDSELYLELLKDMIDYAYKYVYICMTQSKLTVTLMDYKVANQEILYLEEQRSLTHNALIGAVNAMNRACDKINCPKIYEGENHRIGYAEFAMNLVSELFRVRP